MTSNKDFFVSLEWVWRFSKLSPNSLQTRSKLICFHFFSFFFLFYYFFGKGEWVWSEFGYSPNSLQTRSKLICFHFFRFFCFTFFWKRGMSLEWVWRFSKLSPNSYVFIFLLFTFFGQEEWVWSEFGDSPNWLQIRSKFICVHVFSILLFFWKEEWVWSEFGDYPNSLQTHSKLDPNSNDFMFYCVFPLLFFHFCLEKTNDFGVSLEILQTLSKLAPNSYVFRFFCFFCSFLFIIFFTFLGKGEWVWSEFGDSPNSPQTQMISIFCCVFSLWEERNELGVSLEVLQTLFKLTPNSLQTHMVSFCCFFFIVNLLFFSFFWKRNEFSFSLLDLFKEKEMNLEVPQSLSNLAEGTCSYSAGTWNYIFWPLFYWNISNKLCERISPGAAKLVQVIKVAWKNRFYSGTFRDEPLDGMGGVASFRPFSVVSPSINQHKPESSHRWSSQRETSNIPLQEAPLVDPLVFFHGPCGPWPPISDRWLRSDVYNTIWLFNIAMDNFS